jgi:hypothetical protein
MPPERISTLVFDILGTVVDERAVATRGFRTGRLSEPADTLLR